MKYSLAWIKDYVPVSQPLEKLVDRLTMAGLEVVSVEGVGDDTILEIEVTPNRPDLLSHIGVAREIAVLTGVKLRLPRTAGVSSQASRAKRFVPLTIRVLDKRGCPRYIGRLFDSVQVDPSPVWLQERLERLGLRPVNNIVDITNCVLLEWGQPLHAFDYDCLAGGTLLIRAAKQGERLMTIDGENRQLKEGQLIIADAERPVAAAGVVGGRGSEITGKTRRVLLESALFDPGRIRQSSRTLGLVTESSYRFERGVSWEGVLAASERAAALFNEIAQAKSASRVVDIGRRPSRPKAISLNVSRLKETLGISLTPTQAGSFLKSLECHLSGKGGSLRTVPPSFRRDLREEEDLIEEVARLYGYDRIPVSLPSMARQSLRETAPLGNSSRALAADVRSLLIAQGLCEAMTYSLLSQSLHERFSTGPAIRIQNPLSPDQQCMRSSLIPRLVEAAAYNFHHRAEGVQMFELGPVYDTDGNGAYRERLNLGVLFAGKTPSDWKTRSRPYDYFDLKGTCELVCKALGLDQVVHQEGSFPFLSAEGGATALLWKGEAVGYYGELSSAIRQVMDLAFPVYVAELDFSGLIQKTRPLKRYTPIPKHPSVVRDVSLVIRQGISSRELQETIQQAGGELLHQVFLFDEYVDPSHKVVPKGARGLAYRMEFLHPQRTLTQQEVDQALQSIRHALTTLGAQIRST